MAKERKDPLLGAEQRLGSVLVGVLRRMQNEGRLRDSTITTYARLLGEFHDFSNAPFLGITTTHTAAYLAELNSRNIRQSTIRKNVACLHSVVEFVIAHRGEVGIPEYAFPSNPFTPFLPQDTSDEVDFRNVAKPEDLQRFLSALSPEDPRAVAVLLCCKLLLRTDEFLYLTCDDVFYAKHDGKRVLSVRAGKDLTLRDLLVPKDLEPVLVSVKEGSLAVSDTGNPYLIAPESKDRDKLRKALQTRLYRTAKKLSLSEQFGFNALRNLGIALCNASDDDLREHLALLDDRHDRRLTVLRQLSDRVSDVANTVQIELVYKTIVETAPRKRGRPPKAKESVTE